MPPRGGRSPIECSSSRPGFEAVRASAILPVKRFGGAKRRLESVAVRDRAALAEAMLADVLAAITAAESVERVIVVTGERRAERLALRQAQRVATPIEVLRDPDDAGHPEAATLGIIRALALGAECAALLPGDCPLLDPRELDDALERMNVGRVAVIPDRHGTGTNGLLLSPPDAIGPAFGPGSRERHVDLAQRRGMEVAVEELGSLALDLDTPDDLAELAATVRSDPTRAPETARALATLESATAG
jgi:2-phospho-L-lactate guanylyltransferase